MYHTFEMQWSARNHEVRPAIGSGPAAGAATRPDNILRGSGLAKSGLETRVAALVTVSDATVIATYGEKNMLWHGVYGKAHITL
jgi:hypothetical protein